MASKKTATKPQLARAEEIELLERARSDNKNDAKDAAKLIYESFVGMIVNEANAAKKKYKEQVELDEAIGKGNLCLVECIRDYELDEAKSNEGKRFSGYLRSCLQRRMRPESHPNKADIKKMNELAHERQDWYNADPEGTVNGCHAVEVYRQIELILNPEERCLFRWHHGIGTDDGKGKSMTEIARCLGMNVSEISRKLAAIKKRIVSSPVAQQAIDLFSNIHTDEEELGVAA